MTRVEELLRDAARALRALADKSIIRRSRFDAPIHAPVCSVCLRAALGGNAIEHAESCAVGAAFAVAEDLDRAPFEMPVFSETEITAMRLADDAEPVATCAGGIIRAFTPPSGPQKSWIERNFITGNSVRHIEYEVPEHPWASEEGPLHPAAVTHEEAAARGAEGQ